MIDRNNNQDIVDRWYAERDRRSKELMKKVDRAAWIGLSIYMLSVAAPLIFISILILGVFAAAHPIIFFFFLVATFVGGYLLFEKPKNIKKMKKKLGLH